jgi:hypothetical protein
MLFLVILLKALVIAIIAYAVGAGAALLLWLVGLVTPLKIPAFIRWGGAGITIAVLVFFLSPEILTQTYVEQADWRTLDQGTTVGLMIAACLALAVTGLIISLTKMAVKGTVKGVKAVSNALSQDTPPQPPPLP